MVWSKDVRVGRREPKELKDNEVKVKVSWLVFVVLTYTNI